MRGREIVLYLFFSFRIYYHNKTYLHYIYYFSFLLNFASATFPADQAAAEGGQGEGGEEGDGDDGDDVQEVVLVPGQAHRVRLEVLGVAVPGEVLHPPHRALRRRLLLVEEEVVCAAQLLPDLLVLRQPRDGRVQLVLGEAGPVQQHRVPRPRSPGLYTAWNHNSKQLTPPENVGLLIVAQRDSDQWSAVVERLLHA